MKILLSLLLPLIPFLGDYNAGAPPHPLDTTGGKTSPVYSAAASEASYWISLIDQQQYAASWGNASGLLQDIITQDQWVAAMEALRRPLGQVTARKAGPFTTTQQLPGGTRGNFLILTYETSFYYKPNSKETITLMTEKYGKWSVVSYSISK